MVGAHGGREELRLADHAIGIDVDDAHQRRTVFTFLQRAQVVGQDFRQHGDVLARQVDGEGARARLFVDTAAFRHVGGRVRDGDAQGPAAFRALDDVQGVIHVTRLLTIDGEEGHVGHVFASQAFLEQRPVSAALRRGLFQRVTCQGDAPRHTRVVHGGDDFLDLGEEAAVVLAHRVTQQTCHDPVAIIEGFLIDATLHARFHARVDGGVVRHHVQAAITLADTSDEAIDTRLNQHFRLYGLLLTFHLDGRFDGIAVQYLLHGGWRHEERLAVIAFEEAEALVGAFDHPRDTGNFLADLIFQLRQQRIVLQHFGSSVGGVSGSLYGHGAWGKSYQMAQRPRGLRAGVDERQVKLGQAWRKRPASALCHRLRRALSWRSSWRSADPKPAYHRRTG